eukprot:TRINITY_DN9445_c0_g2_i1.p1 TRINITY_DN9445_c0_g2~~TRINITY_DN9445_c0_g2_i1.p1  ORF type:complete len:171 (+),score=49.63 TRINITY_DN9445_c0_g2_i1:3-515(+)
MICGGFSLDVQGGGRYHKEVFCLDLVQNQWHGPITEAFTATGATSKLDLLALSSFGVLDDRLLIFGGAGSGDNMDAFSLHLEGSVASSEYFQNEELQQISIVLNDEVVRIRTDCLWEIFRIQHCGENEMLQYSLKGKWIEIENEKRWNGMMTLFKNGAIEQIVLRTEKRD